MKVEIVYGDELKVGVVDRHTTITTSGFLPKADDIFVISVEFPSSLIHHLHSDGVVLHSVRALTDGRCFAPDTWLTTNGKPLHKDTSSSLTLNYLRACHKSADVYEKLEANGVSAAIALPPTAISLAFLVGTSSQWQLWCRGMRTKQQPFTVVCNKVSSLLAE